MARKHTLKYLATLILAASLPVFAFGAKPPGPKQQPAPTSPPTTSSASEMTSTIVDRGGFPNAAGLDVLGRPCTAFFAGAELRFAVYNGVSWQVQSIGPVGGDFGASSMDMVVDASGRPTIVFSVPWEGGTNNNHLYVASSDGTSWKVESLDYFSWGPSIAVGPDGRKYIVYIRSAGSGAVLKLAENIGLSWAISTVDDSNVASGVRTVSGPAIAVDGLGNVGVSYGYYIHAVTKQARYAYRTSGGWTVKSLLYDLAQSSALSFDPANRPVVAFWVASGGLRLMYADESGKWLDYLVPWTGGMAAQLSLALDDYGTAYMTAYDVSFMDLRLISGRPGNFVNKVVASTGTVGKSNSLVVSKSASEKCVTFSDESNGVLKFVDF